MTISSAPKPDNDRTARSYDTSVILDLQEVGTITFEEGALVSYEGDAKLEDVPDDSFSAGLRRAFSGDSFNIRRIVPDGAAVAEFSSASTSVSPIIALNVDSDTGIGYTVSDGAWIAHSEGVKKESEWKGIQSAMSRESAVMSHLSGSGVVLLEGLGSVVHRSLEQGEALVLGQGRLVAYSDTIAPQPITATGRRLLRMEGPGEVVYKSHSKNVKQ